MMYDAPVGWKELDLIPKVFDLMLIALFGSQCAALIDSVRLTMAIEVTLFRHRHLL